MWDFLTFKRLISIEVLITFYYLGAVVMPVFMLWGLSALRRRFSVDEAEAALQKVTRSVAQSLGMKLSLWKWFLAGVFAFLLGELFWRLLFEFLVAFIQMRDALVAGV